MDKYIGKRVEGRYEIRELIGVGGMANVYKGYDLLENRLVAVKILKEEFLQNEELLRRFKNESKAIALLSHPNIVKVYDVCFIEKMHSIVMEYIDGITLKEYIDQQGSLKWKEAVHFTVQILRALQHAHDNGIVHRDIKPHNIMLLPDGSIKVMDFGIARFARSESHTVTDKAIGSVHYISPEQACGNVTDEKSDIYSVGVMLFEMLTGKLPFEAENAVSVVLMQVQSEPKKLRQVNADVPEGLEEIVTRAMQKDASRRYQSAAEMLRDIDNFKKNPDILFEYKYLSGDEKTQFFNKRSDTLSDLVSVSPSSASDEASEEGEEGEEEEKSSAMSVLMGVAISVVVVALLFVGLMVFILGGSKNSSIDLVDFRGQMFSEIKSDPKYQGMFVFVEQNTEFSNDIEAGKIISQTPKPPRKVKKGSVIEFVISKGPKLVTVPDVENMDQATAEMKMKELGFKYVSLRTADPEVASGYVIKTSPEKNLKIAEGSEVTIYVSIGPKAIYNKIPDVVGFSLTDAKRVLEGLQFKCEVIVIDHTAAKDKVVSTLPEADTSLEQGKTVTITVSSGNAPKGSASVNFSFDKTVTSEITYRVVDNGIVGTEYRIIPSVKSDYRYDVQGNGKISVIIQVKVGSKWENYKTYSVDFTKTPETVKLEKGEDLKALLASGAASGNTSTASGSSTSSASSSSSSSSSSSKASSTP